MNISELLLTNHNRPRIAIKPKYLVIHWTANEGKGADARANRNYFQNTDRSCSAHYLVDDKEIVRAIPDNEMAYHIGAQKYYHVDARNSNSIGIEMCVNADGNFAKMRDNTVQMAADICKRYGINPMSEMIRHYDVTKKDCPRFFVQDGAAWDKFRQDVVDAMLPPSPVKEEPELNIGKCTLSIDGRKLDGFIIDGTSYAPIRKLAEELGLDVAWDDATRTVTLKRKDGCCCGKC